MSGKAATERVNKEREVGQRVAKIYHTHMSFCSPLASPPSPSPLIPRYLKQVGLQSSQTTATILVWGPQEGAANLSHLAYSWAFCFGNARAGVKLCLELADTALGAKVYSWRRD